MCSIVVSYFWPTKVYYLSLSFIYPLSYIRVIFYLETT
ncbi:unnamed protein product [Spirodela intermedia]|uniref:Uncharacterized protein n=1 Tax=Spirodela intermedia TaxID=51605 RepID=A0A7I8JIF6_SPIIN|nr:unnamed protein product [Spirodela intermedia]CAA6669202.1 unnamed protein product [Spirodela intermedia]